MASSDPQGFILTPQQQSLLFAALHSNKQPAKSPATNGLGLSPAIDDSGLVNAGLDGVQESPFLDYDYDFSADSGFDFDFSHADQRMIGDLPGTSSSTSKPESENSDSPEKRGHPDDDEDEDGDPKRRESGDKTAKKPGRKPLTTEPTSKRKAQNRAAQRAFRERKEKHLKDLETKVAELEKASETTTHENTLLRAQIEKMTVELNQYKKQLSTMATANRPVDAATRAHPFGRSIMNNLNDVSFQFEFPKFGLLPGPSPASSNGLIGRQSTDSPRNTRSPTDQVSPADKSKSGSGGTGSSVGHNNDLDQQRVKDDLAKFSGIFTPSLSSSNSAAAASRTSLDSHFSAAPTASSSPSESSNSNSHGGTCSSCGTSPESCNQSPMGFKPLDTMATIGEEQSTTHKSGQESSHLPAVDLNDMSWLSTNNNSFQFDPQLFGDYREPQENILSSGGFDDSFFNDAFEMDFTTPYNVAPSPILQKKEAPKKDLISQIDAAKNDEEPMPLGTDGQLLTCNKIWEKLQTCPKVQNGDFDLEGLCSDLQKKAKCSGSGAVVDEKDFKKVMQKYLGKSDKEMAEDCPSFARPAAAARSS